MRLLVGLGNPGAAYQHHRHNVGFMAIDALRDAFGFDAEKKAFSGLVSEGVIAGERCFARYRAELGI